jgi:hypothetical protein
MRCQVREYGKLGIEKENFEPETGETANDPGTVERSDRIETA